ncbi:protein indeterminate-domain 16-like [Cynara cardunculus var. scolymus]|nr:protein indeterminate-domain 16-like [Cynara cardunculus var. scolymus]
MELQLLPTPHPRGSRSRDPTWSSGSIRFQSDNTRYQMGPSLDLQLSNSSRPVGSSLDDCILGDLSHKGSTKALKWQEADQIRITSTEKAYVERVREMTQREMDLAQSELSCARHMWERAQEDVARAENMKAKATHWIDSTCMEITCQACRQTFRP